MKQDQIGDEFMEYPLIRECIANGVYFSSITDKKFKHNRISVNLIVKLDREKAEEARWDVDEASLALYLDSIPMFYFPRHQLPAALYEDDLMLLFTKQITSEEFCTRLRRIQRMWSLENQ